MPPDGNGWDEWKIFVLKELERLSKEAEASSKNGTRVLGELSMVRVELEALTNQVSQGYEAAREAMALAVANKNELTGLGVKAGMWGALGAAVPSAALLLWQLMR